MREQNHRVKNNLQMINSLLSLQSQKLLSADAKDVLLESQSRINSVALLHRMLYDGERVGEAETSAYVRLLLEEIRHSAVREIEIELDLPEKLDMKVERLTSLGLIINELLVNSIKHVDPAVKLQVRLHLAVHGNRLHFTYTDNGAGVEPKARMSSDSFGNQLIQIQGRQLEGEFEVSVADGFKYDLRILT